MELHPAEPVEGGGREEVTSRNLHLLNGAGGQQVDAGPGVVHHLADLDIADCRGEERGRKAIAIIRESSGVVADV